MLLKNSEPKWKNILKIQNCFDLLVKKCNKEIWQEQINVQDINKGLNVQKSRGKLSMEHLPFGKSQMA